MKPAVLTHPRAAWRTEVGPIAAGATLTAMAAQVSIPTVPVPITLQSLAVVLCGMTLGARRGMLSQLTYVLVGAAGAPVFAEFGGGPAKLIGPTGGYLVAFILAAGLVGALRPTQSQGARAFGQTFGVTLLAHAFILGLGAAWLARFIGVEAAIASGVVPFLIGSVLKCAVATLAVPLNPTPAKPL